MLASADLLDVVGARPAYGRLLEAADDVEGAELVAVVSHRFWRRVSGDPTFVGQRLSPPGDAPITVVGVLQPDVAYPVDADIWLPLVPALARDPYATLDNPRAPQFHVVGRLAPDVAIGQARSELAVIHGRLSAAYPEDYPRMPIVVTPLVDTVVGHVRPILVLLLAGAALVFLVAGANVAILLLMRAESRRVEMAVRSALGATRGQLFRQTVIEAAVLGVAGVAGALMLSRGLLALTNVIDPGQAPRIDEASLNLGVMAFTVVAMTAWVLAFGTAPAWQTRVGRLRGFLAQRSVEPSRGTGRRLQVLAAAQIAFAVLVLVSAGLLTRSLWQLQSIDRGLESDGVVTTRILLPWQRYRTPDQFRAFYDRAVEAIERLPGVISAAPFHLPPGTGTTGLSSPFQFNGQTPDEAATNEWANWDIATPGYFETLGIPIVSGRDFARTDTADAQRVAIVSESAAARYWPGAEPIGKRVRISPRFEWATVVGIAADLRYRELTNNWMTVYYPAPQSFHFQPGSLAIRTGRPPSTLLSAVRETIRAIEPAIPIDTLTPMDELLAAEFARPRLAMQISIAFGVVTLALILVGLFGTVSFDARQRRVEMAIRSALGASPHALQRLVAGRGLRLAAAGLVTGLAATATGSARPGRGIVRCRPARSGHAGHRLRRAGAFGRTGMLDSGPTGGVHRPLRGVAERRLSLRAHLRSDWRTSSVKLNALPVVTEIYGHLGRWRASAALLGDATRSGGSFFLAFAPVAVLDDLGRPGLDDLPVLRGEVLRQLAPRVMSAHRSGPPRVMVRCRSCSISRRYSS